MKKYFTFENSEIIVALSFTVIFILGMGVVIYEKVNAQSYIEPYQNPLFDKIDPATGFKIPKNNKAPKEYTQLQNDMTMLYGRLDYIVNQLNQLQDTCSIR